VLRTRPPAVADIDFLPAGDLLSAGDRLPPDVPAVRRPIGRLIAARLLDVLAGGLVLAALLLPDRIDQLSPAAFARIPVEALVATMVVLLLPTRAGRRLATGAGAVLGVLSLMTLLDLGFRAVLARPFDPILDLGLAGDAVDFLTSSIGRAGAISCAIGAVLLAVTVVVLLALAVRRLARLAVRHRAGTGRGIVVLGVVWLCCAALGLQLFPGQPVAAATASELTHDRAVRAAASVRDRAAFAAQTAHDAFGTTPGADLLTGLSGKDVMVAFVESYGRSAVSDPQLSARVDPVLDDGTRRLAAAGFASRSAFLTSPTAGGGSWLAHSTLLSGLWIDNQQRYRTLVAGDRLTLNEAFHKAGWRTVGVMPGVTRAWPEGAFYGYDKVYDSHQLGYRGPHFSWAPMPDQYALEAFRRIEPSGPGHVPTMTEIPLVSSHGPWAPLPQLIDWNAVGDGSVYAPMAAAGEHPDDVWRDPARVRDAYARSIAYSLSTLISYLQTYGNDNTVLVFLGDHQPAPIVTGPNASRDVPITIVARDPKVLERIAGWGWQDGLRPGSQAPVWRMDSFRDRFLTAFGPQPAG
jgi:hypothetical protein